MLLMGINAGVIFRVVFCITHMIHSPDERGVYMRRIRNILIFCIMANTIIPFREVILSYIIR
ncbi:hypothetical protein AKG39_06460 [Acetobacterium bakii]|uniref:Uncharacterized protein n=2 Tax=Acetobacterium bakii TaxID=52689 RepID=A0A0L6U3U7_9FIRM|nr:hypothetical protein AKG39_06460 [Acetobacterium bakii]